MDREGTSIQKEKFSFKFVLVLFFTSLEGTIFICVWLCVCVCAGIEENQNGMDSNVGEDSDSLGNSKSSKTSITPPTKEKRKPFFKKVSVVAGVLF